MPLERAEEARAGWLERYPEGFEERDVGDELELAAYTEDAAPPAAHVEHVEPGWEDRWREFHQPSLVGPFWIGPPWHDPPPDARPIVIDPGQAFGTGAHATTQLCIELLAELEPADVLDVGCGSGVLAIAAALLGCAPVVAIDSDPAAVDAALRNAVANGVEIDVRELDAATARLPAAEIVLANVSRPMVETLLTRIDARHAVTSGYLERDDLPLGRYRRCERRTRDGWAADLLERSQ